MTIIIPTKGSATSGLLDVWQAHIQQQQADKAQSAAQAAGAGSNAANATNTTNVTGVRAPANAADNATDAPSDGDTILAGLRTANEGAKRAGKAMAGGASGASDASGGGNSIVADTIKKLKDMLAKVMAQLDAVRNNDRLPPEEKLQQITALSSEAMAIQGQITALMDPTKTSGTRINTTA
ncbi:FlxA-like family protein [Pandoraea sp. NPDC087047]|uniref:FlxA-like family protein n=1 Tax=Pandoraea sp. NPDC087047 TaxID=3364390 RepID=UPI00381DD267